MVMVWKRKRWGFQRQVEELGLGQVYVLAVVLWWPSVPRDGCELSSSSKVRNFVL